MPEIFDPIAYKAVLPEKSSVFKKIRREHFEEDTLLEEALSYLTPQQRCDAIYAEWLQQINSSSGRSQIRERKLLVQQGGLAANYLAEFAQNADDACRNVAIGEVRIWTRPGWLFVANNGQGFTGLDLRGLCRFFANGTKIDASSDEMIGKFGIGFKSCYRIGAEVWVSTWERSKEDFCFRLPLCRSELPESHYDQTTFDRVLKLLEAAGSQRAVNSRSSQDELGFCTPEFKGEWPSEIANELVGPRRSFVKQGSVFAVKLHEKGAAVLRERLKTQQNQIYELCPLFLHRLRQIVLEDTSLTLIKHRLGAETDVVGGIEVSRATIEAKAGNAKSNVCFWLLSSPGKRKVWSLAIHADSGFKISFKIEPGETTSLRDGAAYAFFPLSIPWPFRVHLHLDLPTNLDRSNWSPENAEESVRNAIETAAASLGQWLQKNHASWHQEWNVAQLVERVPSEARQEPEKPARWFYEALRAEVLNAPLLRTVWGSFAAGRQAHSIQMRDDPIFPQAWRKLFALLPTLGSSHLWCLEEECMPWEIPEILPKEIIVFAESWRANVSPQNRDEFSRHLFVALIGLGKAWTSDLERIFGLVVMDEQGTTFAQLCSRPGGATLTPEWHGLFAQLASRTRHETWTNVGVAKDTVHGIFTRFAKAAFNPAWVEAPSVLHSKLNAVKWDEFFTADKEPCPEELVGSVLAALHVRDAGGEMKLLLGVWVLGRVPPFAFKTLYRQVHPPRQAEYKLRLQKWGLWDPYLENLAAATKAGLPGALEATLRVAIEQSNVRTWLDHSEYELNELDQIGATWKQLHQQCVNDTLELALVAALSQTKGKHVLSSSIDADLRQVLAWSSDYIEGPAWLDDSVVQKLNDMRLTHLLSEVQFVRKRDLASQTTELVRSVLEIAHVWTKHAPTSAHYAAINRLAVVIPQLERRNLLVGVGPRKREPLEDFLLLESEAGDPNFYWLRQTRGFAEKLLPAPVGQVAAFREVCPRAGDLKLKAPTLPENAMPFPTSSILPEIAALPDVATLLKSGKALEVYHHHPIELEWWESERCVAEVRNAEFYFEKETGRLFVSRLVASLDDHQIEIVLGNYLQYSAHDREVDEAWKEAKSNHIPFTQVYSRFRKRIKDTLLEALVKKMGYETSYIWREMLQNAENAYASMKEPRPEDRVFEVEVEEGEKSWRVRATNRGRNFNQTDRDGNERRDIDRIISVGGDRVQVAEEIGRYNLGFKSVFSSTDTVEIISGGFEFQVQDLLLRYPANPVEDQTKRERPTSFTWRCNRQDGAKIIGLVANPQRNIPSTYLRAPYALFGRFVNRLVLKFRGSTSELRISRLADLNARSEKVSVTLPTGTVEQFVVLRGDCTLGVPQTKYSYSCAIRLDPHGMPESIPEADRHFHLVYPTEEKAFVNYLVDADFEPVGVDRRQLRKNKRNLLLILSGARLVFDYAIDDLSSRFSRERWLAWVEVIDPKGLAAGVGASYDGVGAEGDRLAAEFKTELLKRVPHHGVPTISDLLIVPTRLIRMFARKHGQQFGIKQDNWIDEKIEKSAKDLGLDSGYRLIDWVTRLPQDPALLSQVGDALQDFSDFSPLERPEMQVARESINRRLEPVELASSNWDLGRIVVWWTNNLDPEPYTLEGRLFPWVCLERDSRKIKDPRQYLQTHLVDAASPTGKAIWYRMFTFACLVSAGHRATEMHSLLAELERLHFFDLTSDPDVSFSGVTAPVFEALVQREHKNQWASGEDAHFWRRIFYDARKVHHLVYRNDFAEVFLEMAQRESFGDALPDFLRSGEIPGQQRWHGVLGQSAAAPLLFIVRELRRLRIIEHSTVDSVAFFACKPVRRIAARLRWIDEGMVDAASWSDLLRISRILHGKFTSSDEARESLLPYYDIPLLALDQSGEMI